MLLLVRRVVYIKSVDSKYQNVLPRWRGFQRKVCVPTSTPQADFGTHFSVSGTSQTIKQYQPRAVFFSVTSFGSPIMRVFTQFAQMCLLIITRHRDTSIVPHLRTHLEHIVLQLLLMAELRKKPTFLCFRRLRTELECHFHDFSRITPLTPYQWVGPTRYQAVTLIMSVQRDTSIKPQFAESVKCFFKKTLWPHIRP